MFCTHCGTALPSSANFCSACGKAVSAVADVADEPEVHFPPTIKASISAKKSKTMAHQPLFKIKPRFVLHLALLGFLPFYIFFTIWLTGFVGTFAMFGMQILFPHFPAWIIYVGLALIVIVGTPLPTIYWTKRNYDKTEYSIYEDHLVYYDGFFTITEKVTQFKNVIEVGLTKGILQRPLGLGTILLYIPQAGSATSNIRITDIENPDEVYEKIKALVYSAHHD